MSEPRLPRKNEHHKHTKRGVVLTPLSRGFCYSLLLRAHGLVASTWPSFEAVTAPLRASPLITGPVVVSIAMASRRRHGASGLGLNDLDGIMPPLFDALQLVGVLANDVLVTDIAATKSPRIGRPGVAIILGTKPDSVSALALLHKALDDLP